MKRKTTTLFVLLFVSITSAFSQKIDSASVIEGYNGRKPLAKDFAWNPGAKQSGIQGFDFHVTSFDYSPEIRPYEVLVTTLKTSEVNDTARINVVLRKYRHYRIGKTVYDINGKIIPNAVPVFAKMEDAIVEPIKIRL